MGNTETVLKEVDYKTAVKELRDKNVYMMLGYGDASLYKDVEALKKRVEKIAKSVKENSIFIYFGDVVNPDSPDIGYAFHLLQKYNPSIKILMIQIDEAKSWGISKLLNVSYVLWHNDFKEKKIGDRIYCHWGGFDPETGMPCSSTKIWRDMVKDGVKIRRAFILGGGKITLEEMRLLISLNIPIRFYPFERKYAGDAKTTKKPIPNDASIAERYGDTSIYIFDKI